jgi:hypothetical protein
MLEVRDEKEGHEEGWPRVLNPANNQDAALREKALEMAVRTAAYSPFPVETVAASYLAFLKGEPLPAGIPASSKGTPGACDVVFCDGQNVVDRYFGGSVPGGDSEAA